MDAAPKRPEWKQDWEGWGYNTDTLHLRAPQLLFLPASSLFECQVNQRATRHVVISQGVGILDEDALRGGKSAEHKPQCCLPTESHPDPNPPSCTLRAGG